MKNKITFIIVLLSLIYSCRVKESKKNTIQEIKKNEITYDNFLTGKIWETDTILTNAQFETYNLKKFVSRKFAGNLTVFTDTLSFTSEYVAPCGNDNFTTVKGDYKFLGPLEIEIAAKTVEYTGDWDNYIKELDLKKVIYIITKSESGLVFTKSN